MRKRWYVLAALLGLLTALAVWFRPESPLWIGHVGAGTSPIYMQGFSPDGRVFVATRTPPSVRWDEEPAPVIYRWDAVSGKLLSRVTLDCPDSNMTRRVRVSPDGTTVLAGETPITDPTSRGFITGKWYLHDGITGKRRAGPIAGVAHLGMGVAGEFSPDSRWFYGLRGDPSGGKPVFDGVNICSAETGEVVVELPNQEHWKVSSCYFATDGSTVVVSGSGGQKNTTTGPGNHRILELPYGREVCRFDLPARNWGRCDTWDGRHLEVVEKIPDAGTGRELWRICRLEVTKDGVGEVIEQPHLSALTGGTAGANYWIGGTGWVAYCSIVPPPAPPPAWWVWTASKVGIHQGPVSGVLATARVVDTTTNTTRYELPHPVVQPIQMSPDGRLLACRGADDSVHVWDMAPPPRWPKAAALGAVVAGGVLGVGHERRRRQVKPPAS